MLASLSTVPRLRANSNGLSCGAGSTESNGNWAPQSVVYNWSG